MPIFTYLTKDITGIAHKGEIEARDEFQAARILRGKKLIIISLTTRNEFQEKYLDQLFNKVSFAEVVVTTRQLATMVSSGLILSEALDILADQEPNPRFKKILSSISADIKGGMDFATALEKFPDVFPNIYAKLVRAGQISGKLDTILLELATNLEKERIFKSRIGGAMIYPIVVVCMMIGVALVMVFFVVPKLTGLYSESSIELPLPTKIMLSVTGVLLSYWWLFLIIIIGITVASKRYISTPEGRFVFDKLMLKMPVVNKIINLVILTNFTRTFALLVGSGVSILESIKIVADVTGNLVYKAVLDSAYKGVERGLTLSAQLLNTNVFPKLVGQMIKTGEETGKLDEVLFKLADYFESEADESLKNITTIIEPVILLILGLGVAFLVVSIILPIYQLTTNIK